jgi:hypothetical protein
MKRLMLLSLFLGILLVSVGFVFAEENDTDDEIECDILNREECRLNPQCAYYPNDRNKSDIEGWCKRIRRERKGDEKLGPKGYAFGHRFRLNNSNMSFEEFKKQVREGFGNKSEINENVSIYLGNGRKANLKIMPHVARQRALERLRLKVCNEDNNCSIELKEVGKGEGNRTRAAYEVQILRHHKLLGMFRIKARNRVQIDAETGEIIGVKKPWWAFLSREESEIEDTEGNETEGTEE